MKYIDMGKTKYLQKWEVRRPWLTFVSGESLKADCVIWKKDVFIDKCGVSQVVSYSHGKGHMTNEETSRGQTAFAGTENGTFKLTERKNFLSQEEKVMKAETLNALHYVQYNLCYSSAA